MKRFFFVSSRFTSGAAFVFFLFFVFGGVTGNGDDDESIIIRRLRVGFLNLPTGFLSVEEDSIINFLFIVPPSIIIYFVYKKNE